MISTWELRTQLCESANKRISILEAIADDKAASPKVRIVAIAVLLSYGLGLPQNIEQTGVATLFNTAPKQ